VPEDRLDNKKTAWQPVHADKAQAGASAAWPGYGRGGIRLSLTNELNCSEKPSICLMETCPKAIGLQLILLRLHVALNPHRNAIQSWVNARRVNLLQLSAAENESWSQRQNACHVESKSLSHRY